MAVNVISAMVLVTMVRLAVLAPAVLVSVAIVIVPVLVIAVAVVSVVVLGVAVVLSMMRRVVLPAMAGRTVVRTGYRTLVTGSRVAVAAEGKDIRAAKDDECQCEGELRNVFHRDVS